MISGQRSEHFCRPPTRSGGRNMQDTTLSISVDGVFLFIYLDNHPQLTQNYTLLPPFTHNPPPKKRSKTTFQKSPTQARTQTTQ